MNYPLLIFFGIIPSIIWLLFYLRKDILPESNSMILKVFIMGMIATLPAALIELGMSDYFKQIPYPNAYVLGLFCLLGIALPEELMKYLVVKIKVISHAEFDEPIDAMLYMIVAALGFSAMENILTLFPFKQTVDLLSASWVRFVSATFLHALVSALIGYFMALSFYNTKNRLKLIFTGLTLAVILHGLYDFFIIMKGPLSMSGPIILLIVLTIFISYAFKKVKKMKSICLYSKN